MHSSSTSTLRSQFYRQFSIFTHAGENRLLNTHLEMLYAVQCWTGLTLIGEYHFRGEEGLRMLFARFLGSGNSYSCSGILTLAFLAFSNLAPSSVEPFSPQRTWKDSSRKVRVEKCFRKAIRILPCNLHGNVAHVSQAQTLYCSRGKDCPKT